MLFFKTKRQKDIDKYQETMIELESFPLDTFHENIRNDLRRNIECKKTKQR